ncbi:hypothetical protein [Mesorhizobium sp. LSHC412B00]|uniref:hypothetical protein n=1 Tax=Mesorhizobium sp. LSHC412B00 TaxID=1287285 RepID=UPI0018DDBE9F|nr:hypothetical protein [Mesorhizobium sp. LSHC412B00]
MLKPAAVSQQEGSDQTYSQLKRYTILFCKPLGRDHNTTHNLADRHGIEAFGFSISRDAPLVHQHEATSIAR